MSITIECNGIKVEADTEKQARKELRRLVKIQEAESIKRSEDYRTAKLRADANGYRVLARFMAGEEFPNGWTCYTPSCKWFRHMAVPLNPECGHVRTHKLNTEQGEVAMDHYGNDLVGAVCNGAGFCWMVFLRDRERNTTSCYAIGAHDGCLALSECPTIRQEQFRTSSQEV